ncbi:MAG: filamentous hemagglutinin N-terminal domain-containing protein, partial [Cyanobacteria bacterium P01_H01_bin.152]
MPQSRTDGWKFSVIKSLRRSPLILAGWILLGTLPEAATVAALLSPESNSSSELAIADDLSTATPLSTVILSDFQVLPQFSQSLQSRHLLAQAITPAADGTGTVVNQAGNTFEITGGTQAGDNLFHSFQHFGLSADQAATILSSPDIANILGRVVGGDASFINGLLQVTGGSSNLFLINPAGIIFGPDATVLMPAAFTATTADAVQIGDYWFEAMGTPDYATLIGEPTGFAFATDTPGMVINAGSLTAAPNSAVTLLGGFVLNTGSIATPGGTINIATVPGENLVRITPEGSLLSLELPLDVPETNPDLDVLTANDLPALLSGEVTTEELGVLVEGDTVRLVTTNTEIPTDAGTTIIAGSLDTSNTLPDGMGGEIDVIGDRVALIDADLNASGTVGGGTILIGGDYQGEGDVPNADFTYVDSISTINADALESGDGGTVIVWADETTQFFGELSARGGSESGDGGFVEVSGQKNLGFDGIVDVGAENGSAGTLLLDPTDIKIVETGGANDD